MKKITYLLVITAAVLNLGGCKKAEDVNPIRYEDSSDITETMYMGNSGWNVLYDEQFFDMNELTKGQDIELIYKGECNGTAYVEIAEVKGTTAKELIDEKKAEYESTSELYDAGKDNRSGYVFYVPDIVPSEKIGNDRYTSVRTIDLSDGVLLITESQMLDEKTEVSDRISDVINSIEM